MPLKKKFLFSFIVVFISFLLVAGGTEVYLRLTGYPAHFTYRIADPVNDMWHLPNREGDIHIPIPNPEFIAHVQTNSLGMLEDREYSIEKPQGTYRIAVVGDSFVAGLEVPMKKRFPRLLEKQLAKSTGKKIQVMNFGVRTISPAAEVQIYNTKVRQFHPDLVLMHIYLGNDLGDDDAFYRDHFPDPLIDGSEKEFRPDKKAEVFWRRFNVMLSDYTRVYPFIRLKWMMLEERFRLYRQRLAQKEEVKKEEKIEEAEKELPHEILSEKEKIARINQNRQFKLLYRLIEKLNANVQRDGGKFRVYFTDYRGRFSPNERPGWVNIVKQRHQMQLVDNLKPEDEYSAIMAKMKEDGIEATNLMAVFAKDPQPVSFFFKRDDHWNEKGHKAVAAVMTGELTALIGKKEEKQK